MKLMVYWSIFLYCHVPDGTDGSGGLVTVVTSPIPKDQTQALFRTVIATVIAPFVGNFPQIEEHAPSLLPVTHVIGTCVVMVTSEPTSSK